MFDFKTPPDPGWLSYLKIFFGLVLLIILASLAAVLALGKVEQNTSFGLQDLLGGLLVLSGGFSQWCFGGSKGKDKEND
jgi:thiol:disulfide interchange protein